MISSLVQRSDDAYFFRVVKLEGVSKKTRYQSRSVKTTTTTVVITSRTHDAQVEIRVKVQNVTNVYPHLKLWTTGYANVATGKDTLPTTETTCAGGLGM